MVKSETRFFFLLSSGVSCGGFFFLLLKQAVKHSREWNIHVNGDRIDKQIY